MQGQACLAHAAGTGDSEEADIRASQQIAHRGFVMGSPNQLRGWDGQERRRLAGGRRGYVIGTPAACGIVKGRAPLL